MTEQGNVFEETELLNDYKKFSKTSPKERVLLLPQCLRPRRFCIGKFSKLGIVCPSNCMVPCIVDRFRKAALKRGYKGVCVASGGVMAYNYVKKINPQAILAIACNKELRGGVTMLREMRGHSMPIGVVIPLTKEGCVETEVNETQVMETINVE